MPIDPTKHLLADAQYGVSAEMASPEITLQADAQGLLDYAQTTLDTGEELMFTMDIPYVPVQEAHILLAQAATSSAGSISQRPNYILKECQETESAGDPRSAIRGVDPAYMLKNYIQNRDKHYVDLTAIKTTLLEGATHGKITTEVDNTGRTSYGYDAVPNYVGKDRAVFMAEFEGKRYKIVIDLVVSLVVNENEPVCPPPKLIKVNGKPVSGSSGYDMRSISVSIANLDGGAVGQTNGMNITLDTNAAGHNWFIDSTPADNSEFLPTSNPNEWIAKADSDAAGKMDMLSVLLHEYGHALGIDHSADGHDYMATTLTTGVRRMPSAEEMALMQQLVAQVKGEMVASTTDSTLSPTLPLQGGGGLPIPLGAGFGITGQARIAN